MKVADGKCVVEPFERGTDYQLNGFGELLALRDCMKSCGVAAEWDDILGFSGDAFGCDNMDYPSVRVHDALLVAARAYGFASARWGFGEKGSLDDLRSEIAAGRPVVVGAGQFTGAFNVTCWHFLTVGGYDVPQDRLLVAGIGQTARWLPMPAEDGVRGRWNGQCPWATDPGRKGLAHNWRGCPRFLLGDRQEAPPVATRFATALQAGVASYRSGPIEMYWSDNKCSNVVGREYLAQWPARLQEESAQIRKQPIDERDGDPPVAGYPSPILVLIRRTAAATFLRKHADELPARVRPHIMAAATHYETSAARAAQLFETLYGVDELRPLDWYGKLVSVRWYIGEGARMADLVSRYAKNFPDRWAIRTRVIRRVNESLTDEALVRKACALIEDIIGSDDAAVAEIEQALAAAH